MVEEGKWEVGRTRGKGLSMGLHTCVFACVCAGGVVHVFLSRSVAAADCSSLQESREAILLGRGCVPSPSSTVIPAPPASAIALLRRQSCSFFADCASEDGQAQDFDEQRSRARGQAVCRPD